MPPSLSESMLENRIFMFSRLFIYYLNVLRNDRGWVYISCFLSENTCFKSGNETLTDIWKWLEVMDVLWYATLILDSSFSKWS